MNRKIRLTDLVNRKILFEGPASLLPLESGGMEIEMSGPEDVMVWRLLKKGIVIENISPASHTRLRLHEKGSGTARLVSELGELNLPLEEVQIEHSKSARKQKVHLRYSLGKGSDPFEFLLEILSGESSDDLQKSGRNGLNQPENNAQPKKG